MGAFLRKAKAFLRLWVTPIKPLEPGVRYPIKNSYSIIATIGFLLVIWWYSYRQVSYESIPSKPIFWSSFFGWALPFIILGWGV
ncbi:MAG: hypothetical protein AUI50_01390 [Crenarchaeota archaeon 13_1_40CM_2_52_14]|nr:MAG: hypothetical protein AUI97_00145 [Crenarchaeota archaeon 13_1_40CM_3_52_17]OLD35633.1 MAG: hypothetical protein AUI50_01390 [Crenarchaeota archaeon 13_1_40CM_2_52_14]